MKTLKQTVAASAGAVALFLSATLTSAAQLPDQNRQTESVVELSVSAVPSNPFARAQSPAWAKAPLLTARLSASDRLTWFTGRPRPDHATASRQKNSSASRFILQYWSPETILASLGTFPQTPAQTSPESRGFTTSPNKEKKNSWLARRLNTVLASTFQNGRGQQSPYPSGVFPFPAIPGQAQTPATQRLQAGYNLYRWQR